MLMRYCIILLIFRIISVEGSFKKDQFYEYKYDTLLQVLGSYGEKGTASETTSLDCNVLIEGINPWQFRLKITNVSLKRLIGKAWTAYKNLEIEQMPALRKSVIFRLEQGKLTKLLVHEDETEFSLNIKRGIIFHFQVTDSDFKDGMQAEILHYSDHLDHRCVFRKAMNGSILSSVFCSGHIKFSDMVSGFSPQVVVSSKVHLIKTGKFSLFKTRSKVNLLSVGTNFISPQNTVHTNVDMSLTDTLMKLMRITSKGPSPEIVHQFGHLIEILRSDSGVQQLFHVNNMWKSVFPGLNTSETKKQVELYIREALLECRTFQCAKALQYLIVNKFFENDNIDYILTYWICHPDFIAVNNIIDLCTINISRKCISYLKMAMKYLVEEKIDIQDHTSRSSMLCKQLLHIFKDISASQEARILSLNLVSKSCLSLLNANKLIKALQMVNKMNYVACFSMMVNEILQHIHMNASEQVIQNEEMLEGLKEKLLSSVGNETDNSQDELRSKCLHSMQLADHHTDVCYNPLAYLKDFIDPKKHLLKSLKEQLKYYLSEFASTIQGAGSCGSFKGDAHKCFTVDKSLFSTIIEQGGKIFPLHLEETDASGFTTLFQKQLSKLLPRLQVFLKEFFLEKLKPSSLSLHSFFFFPVHSKSKDLVAFNGLPLNWNMLHNLQISFENIAVNFQSSEFKYTFSPNIVLSARNTLSTFLPGILNITLENSKHLQLRKNITVILNDKNNNFMVSLLNPEREQLIHVRNMECFWQGGSRHLDYSVLPNLSTEFCTPASFNNAAKVKFCLASYSQHEKKSHCFQEGQLLDVSKVDKGVDSYTLIVQNVSADAGLDSQVLPTEAVKDKRSILLLKFNHAIQRIELILLGYPESLCVFQVDNNFTLNLDGNYIMRKNISIRLKVLGNHLNGQHVLVFKGNNSNEQEHRMDHYTTLKASFQNSYTLDVNASYHSTDSILRANCLLMHLGDEKQIFRYQVTFSKRGTCPTLLLSHNLTSDVLVFSSNITEECKARNSSIMYINITSTSPSWKALNLDLHQIFLFENPGGESVNISSPYVTVNVTGSWDSNQEIRYKKTALFVLHDKTWPHIKLFLQNGVKGTEIEAVIPTQFTVSESNTLLDGNDKVYSCKSQDTTNMVFRASWSSNFESKKPFCMCYQSEFVSRTIKERINWLNQLLATVIGKEATWHYSSTWY